MLEIMNACTNVLAFLAATIGLFLVITEIEKKVPPDQRVFFRKCAWVFGLIVLIGLASMVVLSQLATT